MYTKTVMFDLDDTLFNNTIVAEVLASHGIDINDVEVHWDIYKMDIPNKVKLEIATAFKDAVRMGNFLPNAGAKELVHHYVELGYTLIAITAREELHREETDKMVKKYFPEIEKIYYVGPEPKSKLVNELGVDIVIDDNPKTIDECLTLKWKPQMYLVSNAMTPHNKNLIPKYIGVPSVSIITNLIELVT